MGIKGFQMRQCWMILYSRGRDFIQPQSMFYVSLSYSPENVSTIGMFIKQFKAPGYMRFSAGCVVHQILAGLCNSCGLRNRCCVDRLDWLLVASWMTIPWSDLTFYSGDQCPFLLTGISQTSIEIRTYMQLHPCRTAGYPSSNHGSY